MTEAILKWLTGLINNPLLVIGLLLIFIAVFLKDEKSAQSPNFKPAALFKKTLDPLPTWAFKILIVLGLLVVCIGILQISGLTGANPIPTSSNLNEIGIESFPVKVFNYDGLQDPKVNQGWAELTISYFEGKANYLFDFELPSDNSTFGYAGLDFRFDPTQDLSGYKKVKVVLNYFDDASFCEMFIKDISYKGDYILLGKQSPAGGSVQINGTQYTYELPLSIFISPNLKAISEIGLSVDTDIVKGNHRITLKQITFLK